MFTEGSAVPESSLILGWSHCALSLPVDALSQGHLDELFWQQRSGVLACEQECVATGERGGGCAVGGLELKFRLEGSRRQ